MKTRQPVCFSLDAKEMAQLNSHVLRKSVSTSGVIRIAIHQFLEQSEKENKNKERKGEK